MDCKVKLRLKCAADVSPVQRHEEAKMIANTLQISGNAAGAHLHVNSNSEPSKRGLLLARICK